MLASLSVLTIQHSCTTVDEEELLYPRRHRLFHGHGVYHRDTDESSVGPRTSPIPPYYMSSSRLKTDSAIHVYRGQQLGSSADPDDVYIKAFVYSWLGGSSIVALHLCLGPRLINRYCINNSHTHN